MAWNGGWDCVSTSTDIARAMAMEVRGESNWMAHYGFGDGGSMVFHYSKVMWGGIDSCSA
jgi:hypothetical protein